MTSQQELAKSVTYKQTHKKFTEYWLPNEHSLLPSARYVNTTLQLRAILMVMITPLPSGHHLTFPGSGGITATRPNPSLAGEEEETGLGLFSGAAFLIPHSESRLTRTREAGDTNI